ncbi:MAG: LytTR family transcriptional regulator DNA-binding domain-containing protein, partial [Defluviitaleaceae bacterium]|nr:LytTR family transcriptional regulator DNA-binding domain-containing protein [Defluviitaleaceae bacterium]
QSYKLTFKHKVEAMDYIVKSDIELKERIVECISNAVEKLTAKATTLQDNFVFKISEDIKKAGARSGLAKDSIISIDKRTILCFMTESDIKHTVIVYTTNGRKQFSGSLKLVEATLEGDKRFYRCQNNLIINLDKVAALDPVQGMLILEGNFKTNIAVRKVKKLSEVVKSYNG